MKYSVGYQINASTDFIDCIIENAAKISEVYFSWGNFANGRNSQLENQSLSAGEAQIKQMQDLQKLSENNIGLNLLFNGNCYGKDSQSRAFFNSVGEAVDYICRSYGLKSITTTSPLIAKFIKNNFSALDIRASVNMKIGTVEGMDYISQYFDSYYIQRELNRNLPAIKKLRKWCDMHGKKLYILANSGCLNNCSVHTFHDNLVSHESEISKMDNAYAFQGICREYLTDKQKQEQYLNITNFIRPEDIILYENYFDGAKLATRVNSNPKRVLKAYMRGHYSGSIMDLLEPNHSDLFYPYILENSNIPNEFGEKVLTCNKSCEDCGYCKAILERSLVKMENVIC